MENELVSKNIKKQANMNKNIAFVLTLMLNKDREGDFIRLTLYVTCTKLISKFLQAKTLFTQKDMLNS